MLRLDIFFSELKYEAVKQQPAYDLPTYFSRHYQNAWVLTPRPEADPGLTKEGVWLMIEDNSAKWGGSKEGEGFSEIF